MHALSSPQVRLYPKNAIIFTQDAAASSPLVIDEGVVRLCIYLPDGQRVVAGFAFAGELIGLTRPLHTVTAEAASMVWAHEWTSERDGFSTDEAHILAHALARATATLAVRSRRQAQARVAAFLVELIGRGFSRSFTIPISRTDIADHLGITVHTISRVLSDFRREKVIALSPMRAMTVLDLPALQALADDGCHVGDSHAGALSSGMFH